MALGNDDTKKNSEDLITLLKTLTPGRALGGLFGGMRTGSADETDGDDLFRTFVSTHTTKPFSLTEETKSPVTSLSSEQKLALRKKTFQAVWQAAKNRPDMEILDTPMRRRGAALDAWGSAGAEELMNILHKVNFRRDEFGYQRHAHYQGAMQKLAFDWTAELHLEMVDHLEKMTGLPLLRELPRDKVAPSPTFKLESVKERAIRRSREDDHADALAAASTYQWKPDGVPRVLEDRYGKALYVPAPKVTVTHDPVDYLPPDLIEEIEQGDMGKPEATW